MTRPPRPLLARLGIDLPILGAPMGGGASGPALVDAVGRAGGLGFLAAGYQTPEAVAAEIATVRASGRPFGVNVFVPTPVPIALADFRAYAARLAPDAARHQVRLDDSAPVEDDDHWAAKLDLLRADPVPVVSFTFGLPGRRAVAALQRAGSVVLVTVTSPAEAIAAAGERPDALVVQSAAAGGHRGTFTPPDVREPAEPAATLPDLVRAVGGRTGLPLIATGGVGTAADVAAALAAGAGAVAIGTLLLRADESAASAVHRAALADPHRTGTVVTRAFTGRPARGLRNEFTDRHSAAAPLGYPAIHHLTRELRRAAAAAGDADRVHLWAGTGFRQAEDRPAAAIVTGIAQGL